MCTSKKHRIHQDFGIKLETGTETIEPIPNEKLLGGIVSSDLKWNNHIRDNEKSLFRLLTSRINALSKISRISSFKTRKVIANGIVMSPLIHLIQLWGGSSTYLLNLLQNLQNRAARLVTKKDWTTPVHTLLQQCGWMSVKQLVEFHSLVLVYKIRSESKPVYLHGKLNKLKYNTRMAANNGIKQWVKYNHELYNDSFVPRSIGSWNILPSQIKSSENLATFKRLLKPWIKSNVTLK